MLWWCGWLLAYRWSPARRVTASVPLVSRPARDLRRTAACQGGACRVQRHAAVPAACGWRMRRRLAGSEFGGTRGHTPPWQAAVRSRSRAGLETSGTPEGHAAPSRPGVFVWVWYNIGAPIIQAETERAGAPIHPGTPARCVYVTRIMRCCVGERHPHNRRATRTATASRGSRYATDSAWALAWPPSARCPPARRPFVRSPLALGAAWLPRLPSWRQGRLQRRGRLRRRAPVAQWARLRQAPVAFRRQPLGQAPKPSA